MVVSEGTDVLQSLSFKERILENSSSLSPLWWNLFRYRICVSLHLVCYVALGQEYARLAS
jgi:hypothetical protein